jgi:hypothetical protein
VLVRFLGPAFFGAGRALFGSVIFELLRAAEHIVPNFWASDVAFGEARSLWR